MQWKMTCDAGHDAESWTVDADTKDEAYDKFMAMDECKKHGEEKHADTMNMDPEAMKTMIMDSISPVE